MTRANRSHRFAPRLLAACVTFALFALISLLLPRSLPGELSQRALTAHDGAPCLACPPPERLESAGVLAGDDGWFVNVRFASAPINSRVRIDIEGVREPLELEQKGKDWRQSDGKSGTKIAGAIVVASVAQRGTLVTFSLPASLRVGGLAVRTAGDRIPAAGFITPTYPEPIHFGVTDVVLLAIVAVTVIYGFRRGAIAEMGDLAAVVLGVAVSAMAFRPVAALFGTVVASPTGAAALASVVLMFVITLGGFLVIPRVMAGAGAAVVSLDPVVNRTVGSMAACIRQLAVLAMMLAVGLDVAVLHWAAPGITSSVVGSALVKAWRSMF